MSEYLTLGKDGIKYKVWNGDRRRQYKIKKKGFVFGAEGTGFKTTVNDKVTVYSKTESTDFWFFNTVEEAEDFFYDEEPIEIIWSKLRIYTKIESGTTLGNIFDTITKDENFKFIVEVLFPGSSFELRESDQPSLIKVVRNVFTDSSNTLTFDYGQPFEDRMNLFKNSPVVFEEMTILTINGNVVAEQRMGWTLLEILNVIFGNPTVQVIEAPMTITKEGLRTSSGNIPIGELASHLMKNVTLADDVTLADIFKFVSGDELLTAFIGMHSWCRGIDEFHKAAKLPKPEEIEDPLDYLQIFGDLESHPDDKKHPGWISFGYDFHGIGPIHDSTKKHYETMQAKGEQVTLPTFDEYGVSMSPMAELASLPLKLDANLDALIYGKNGIEQRIPCKRQYTLLDVLDAIYWDISFYGDPDESEGMKNEVIASMAEAVEEWENNPLKFRNFSELVNKIKAENDDEEN